MARRAHQLPKHLELARGQIEGNVGGREPARLAIEPESAEHHDIFGALRAPHQRTQPGLDFGEVERLAQVVVRACIEARDAFFRAVAGGQHKHRRAVATGPGLAQCSQAAAQATGRAGRGRQAQVQQHGIERLHPPQVIGILDVGRYVDPVTCVGQAAQHHVAQHDIVFDKQDSHGG